MTFRHGIGQINTIHFVHCVPSSLTPILSYIHKQAASSFPYTAKRDKWEKDGARNRPGLVKLAADTGRGGMPLLLLMEAD